MPAPVYDATADTIGGSPMVHIMPLPFELGVIAPRDTTGLYGEEPDVYEAGPPIGGADASGTGWKVVSLRWLVPHRDRRARALD